MQLHSANLKIAKETSPQTQEEELVLPLFSGALARDHIYIWAAQGG